MLEKLSLILGGVKELIVVTGFKFHISPEVTFFLWSKLVVPLGANGNLAWKRPLEILFEQLLSSLSCLEHPGLDTGCLHCHAVIFSWQKETC